MDLLHRIRWANVARAAALAAAVLLVVAWPRLRSDPPPLPPEPRVAEEARAAAPAGEEGPAKELAFEGSSGEASAVGRGGVRTTGNESGARSRRSKRRARREKPRAVEPRRPVPAAPAVRATRPWSPPPARPRSEFGFESR